MTNRQLGGKLHNRLSATLADTEACHSLAETLSDDLYDSTLRRIDDLETRVMDKGTEGIDNPGRAWRELGPLQEEAARLKSELLGRDKTADKANPAARFNRALKPTFDALQEGRGGTRKITDESAADTLTQRIDGLSQSATLLFDTVKRSGGVPTVQQCEAMEDYRKQAGELVREVRGAQGLSPEPGTERAASAGTIKQLTKLPVLKKYLVGDQRDPQGRTPMEDLQGRLELFDRHYALDPGADQKAACKNQAMRLAAIAAVAARGAASEVNDPNLEPRIARSLLGEYQGRMVRLLAPKGQRDDAWEATDLAQALVMDDPVTKLMTGKINPPVAVERIRDMAKAGGVQPSEMLEMLRQQFEMKIGSLTYDEVGKGQKRPDPGAQGNFDLQELTGELSSGQFVGMTELEETPTSLGSDNTDSRGPVFKTDGSGLQLKPAKGQLHTVRDGDTLESLARDYFDDPAEWTRIRDQNKAVRQPDGSIVVLKDLDAKAKLPVGAVLSVPGQQSLLDQLKPYVEAWDGTDDDDDSKTDSESESDSESDEEPPVELSNEEKRLLREAEQDRDNPRADITPNMLKRAAAKLKSPGENDPTYIPAPGVGQDHEVRAPLGSDDKSRGQSRLDLEKLPKKQQQTRRDGHVRDEADKLYGALSQRQYAHLRLLARTDEEEEQEVLAREGMPLDDAIANKMARRYGIDDDRARQLAKSVAAWIGKVPLTVTFTADRLFSDPSKDEPKFGSQYASEVTFSRGEESLQDLIGDKKTDIKDKVGVTGGKKTGWEERGENYMRWRRDKDDREGRHDELGYEDQQIFGAANPAFEKAKGGVSKDYGANYYGNAHFLLSDGVRNRCAYIVRSNDGDDGSARAPVQRKNIEMLIYDMLTTTRGNSKFLDAAVQAMSGSSTSIAPGLNWEVHLYGGFDIRRDVAKIYLPNDIDKDLAKRIKRFAKASNIGCEGIGAKPDVIDVVPEMDPKKVELPPLDDEDEDSDE